MSSLLLFSGGVDSAAIAYWKRPDLLLHIDYGQVPAQGELRAARIIASRLNLPLRELRADCSAIGSGDLAGSLPSLSAPASSWWPFRNQLLVTLGAAVAIHLDVDIMLIGTVASDGLYMDGRPEFIHALNNLLLVQEGGLRLQAPAIHLTASQLVRESGIPCSILAWSHSCHVSDFSCGQCRGCISRYSTICDACP
jgi:7-cyano-7-deazaguanine synthase